MSATGREPATLGRSIGAFVDTLLAFAGVRVGVGVGGLDLPPYPKTIDTLDLAAVLAAVT